MKLVPFTRRVVKCGNRSLWEGSTSSKCLSMAKRSCCARLPAKTSREPSHQGFQNSVEELRNLFPVWHIHVVVFFVISIGFIIYCSLFWGTGLCQFDAANRNEMTLPSCSNPPSCYSCCSWFLFLSTCCTILRKKEVYNIMLLLKCSLFCQLSWPRNVVSHPESSSPGQSEFSCRELGSRFWKDPPKGWTPTTAITHAEAVSFLCSVATTPGGI